MSSLTLIDALIRIKNASAAKKTGVVVKYSVMVMKIIALLVQEKYLKGYHIAETDQQKTIMIDLLFNQGKPAITDIQIRSKPGRRIYAGAKQTKQVLGGLGMAVLTTSTGIMTDKSVRQQKLGGEVLFQIW